MANLWEDFNPVSIFVILLNFTLSSNFKIHLISHIIIDKVVSYFKPVSSCVNGADNKIRVAVKTKCGNVHKIGNAVLGTSYAFSVL